MSVNNNIDKLIETYNAQASTVAGPVHNDYHDDQILSGCDGWPDEHLDRHYDETWYED